jgi:hypothetical protein
LRHGVKCPCGSICEFWGDSPNSFEENTSEYTRRIVGGLEFAEEEHAKLELIETDLATKRIGRLGAE